MSWFHTAVFYQLNVRTYCDGNGDGIGDFEGLMSKLDYLRDLGVDCLWLMPFYASPLDDGGYDVSDYRAIHPDVGTMRNRQLRRHRAGRGQSGWIRT